MNKNLKVLLLVSILLIIISGAFLTAKKINLIATLKFNPDNTPKINEVNIPLAFPGGFIYIEGENFSPNLNENKITLNNKDLPVQSVSGNKIQAVLQKDSHSGILVVSVKNLISTPKEITVPSPYIEFLEFPSGIKENAEFIIHGQHFSPTPEKNKIHIGDLETLPIKSTENTVTAILPEISVNKPLKLETNDFISNEIPIRLIVNPIITDIHFNGNLIGSEIIISGQNFHKEESKNIVKFNDLISEVKFIEPGRLLAKIPNNAVSGNITITVNDVTGNNIPFTLAKGPIISPLEFEKDYKNNLIKLNLTSFDLDTNTKGFEVYLDKTKLSSDFNFQNKIRVILPSNLPAKGKIYARKNGLKGNELEIDFSKELGPKLNFIETPKGFHIGQPLKIMGTNINPQMDRKSIQNLTIKRVEDYFMDAEIPEMQTNYPDKYIENGMTIPISVTGFGFTSNTIGFTVGDSNKIIYRNPEITEIITDKGQHPNEEIYIKGYGFAEEIKDNKVMFEDQPAKIISAGNRELKVKIPKNAKTGNLKITTYNKYDSGNYNIAIIPQGDNIKSLKFEDIDPIKINLDQEETVAAINILNHDQKIHINEIKFHITTESTNINNLRALSNLKLVDFSNKIISEISSPQYEKDHYVIKFSNFDIEVKNEEQKFLLKGDILPFAENNFNYSLKFDAKTDIAAVFKNTWKKTAFDSNEVKTVTKILNPPINCLSIQEKNYCNTESIAKAEEVNPNPNPNQTTEENNAAITPENLPENNIETTIPQEQLNLETTPFSDVPQDKWFNNAIAYLKAKQIINGYSDNTFKPDLSITRAEFLKLTLMGAGINHLENKTKNNNFSDIEGHWAETYINAAVNNKILDGSKTLFEPNRPITRAEAVTIILKSFSLPDLKTNFNFIDTLNHWCQNYCRQAKENNIIQGYEINGNYYFHPNDNLNRAEAAQIIYNVMQ